MHLLTLGSLAWGTRGSEEMDLVHQWSVCEGEAFSFEAFTLPQFEEKCLSIYASVCIQNRHIHGNKMLYCYKMPNSEQKSK